jgi:hypothetical protein
VAETVEVEIDFAVAPMQYPDMMSELKKFFEEVKSLDVAVVMTDPIGPGGGWPVLKLSGQKDDVVMVLMAHGYEDQVEELTFDDAESQP